MNTNPNQIWGGLRRWFRDENVYAGDKVRITYDPLKENMNGRAIVEISIIQRTEITEEISQIQGCMLISAIHSTSSSSKVKL